MSDLSSKLSFKPSSNLSDEEMKGAVIHALALDPRVNTADVVHVSTDAGVVVLSGTVQTADQKAAAEETARRVRGVQRIQNELTVATEGTISDKHLGEEVERALAANPDLTRRVGCNVREGVVDLIGHVEDVAQEDAATRAAGSVPGIKQVISHLQFASLVPERTGPPPDDATLVNRVSTALVEAGIDIHRREIRSDEGSVTLEGDVESDELRRRALDVAANVDGVRVVHDQLTAEGGRSG